MSVLLVGLLVSGCLDPTDNADNPTPPTHGGPVIPSDIRWFPASTSGVPGNRLTLAGAEGLLAVDDPDRPWTIEIAHGPGFAERLSLTPADEPWNLVGARGPRGPVLAYRSPDYSMHVAEWDGSGWVQGHLVPAPAEILGFPALAGSADELVLGFPIMTSVGPSRYSLVRLAAGIPADLAQAERVDFVATPALVMGDVAVHEARIAATFSSIAGGVDLHMATWDELAASEPMTLQGPAAVTPRSLQSSVDFDGQGNVVVGITNWEVGIAVEPLRPAVVHDLGSGSSHQFATRNRLDLFSAGEAIALVWSDAVADYHIGLLQDGQVNEIGRSSCGQVIVLSNGHVASLSAQQGSWVSELRRLTEPLPTCADS